MYQVTFDSDVSYLDYITEGNRLLFSGDQYLIIIKEDWRDSLGYIIRVSSIIEKCVDNVSYNFG